MHGVHLICKFINKMSFSSGLTLARVSCKCLLTRTLLRQTPAASRSFTVSRQGMQMNRFFTRSLWHMCSNKQTTPVAQVSRLTKTCGCCGLHTQGDQDLVSFLEDEIKNERASEKTPGKLPRIKGFEVETDGTAVTCTKAGDKETITIRFNVNNTVTEEGPEDMESKGEPEPPNMLSKPPFEIGITKKNGLTMLISCVFPDDMHMDQEGGDQAGYEPDLIEIADVAMVNNPAPKLDETTYVIEGHMLDGNLYDMLLDMLEERDIDADFVNQLIEFSTSFEHKTYINFLEKVKDFASSK